MQLMPLGSLGAIETNGIVTFGLWLPWVSETDGNVVTVKIIHEADQFLQRIPARQFPLTHSVRPPYGDFWSGTVPIAGTAPAVPGSALGYPRPLRVPLHNRKPKRRHARLDHRSVCARIRRRQAVGLHVGLPTLRLESR